MNTARRAETPEEWFHRRASFYVEAQILFHLNQVGVLSLFAEGSAFKATEMARRLSLEPYALAALLEYVCEIDDFLSRDPEERYSLTDFGKAVLARFSTQKSQSRPPLINMFDVRVGAYGEVWKRLGDILTGEARYGRDFRRDGRFAENGVLKLGKNFLPSLTNEIEALQPRAIIEVGLTTDLLIQLGLRVQACGLYGLDKDSGAIARAAMAAGNAGVNPQYIKGSFFDVDEWVSVLRHSEVGLIFSLHFHELMAQGEGRFVMALRRLRAELPGWRVVALEQPKASHDARATTPETLWLYAQSNILIHHLIGNGRILSQDEWMRIGTDAGCESVSATPCGYLGYHAFVYQL